jgi:hypothetical protein
MPVRHNTSILISLAALACGGGSESGPDATDPCGPSPRIASLAIADSRTDAGPGTGTASITGDFPRTIDARASAFGRTIFPALLAADAFTVDDAGRPTGELFVFTPGTPVVGTRALVPVTLQQLRDPNFQPSGPFALWAEGFDAGIGDYTRWLLPDDGSLGITMFRNAEIGRIGLTVTLSGSWQDAAGTRLGCGRITNATIDAPVVRGAGPDGSLVDTVSASVTGSRTDTLASRTIDGFQTLRPNDTRLLIVATVPGDPARELWLSVNGVPLATDSIPLRELSLEGARAGRDTGSFGMLRVITISGTSPVVAQLWRSTSGWVKLTNLVPGAPLILCGWGTARFSFAAAGHDNASGAAIGAANVTGAVEARYTVLSPADSLVGLRTSRLGRLRLAGPSSARDRSCFL